MQKLRMQKRAWTATVTCALAGAAAVGARAQGEAIQAVNPPSVATVRAPALAPVVVPTNAADHPDAGSPEDARWQDAFAAFAAADRLRAPVPGGVLFVGSSSIRLWDGLEQQFDTPNGIVKRGFGGSKLSDCARYIDRLVLPYRPRVVVVYAGDNDLADGRSPQQVLDSFASFAEGVHRALPDTRIAFVSIKPSPLRAQLLLDVRASNALIALYIAQRPYLEYIDIYSPMLDTHGQVRADLFGPDRLHMNAEGYAIWRKAIAPHLALR